jgi:hypothetical protein
MDDETQRQLEELSFEIWAVRAVAIEFLADKLAGFKNPKKAANLMASRVFENYEKSRLPEASQIRLSETIVAILDDATNAVLSLRQKKGGGGK